MSSVRSDTKVTWKKEKRNHQFPLNYRSGPHFYFANTCNSPLALFTTGDTRTRRNITSDEQ